MARDSTAAGGEHTSPLAAASYEAPFVKSLRKE
jgi:hypothetical protein